ncbi:MAG TPA: CHAT domain-containing protein [Candidatus Angelobacter sp.]
MEEKERPASLVVADLLIRARLAIRPKSPYWLGEKGRLELIEHKSSALGTLQAARDLDPNSESIAIDLASAYFQTGTAMDLVRAENQLFSIVGHFPDKAEHPIEYQKYVGSLRRDSEKIRAAYNLALMCEHQGCDAVKQWNIYLDIDTNGGWADEARRRLSNLKGRTRGHGPPGDAPFLTDWLTYLTANESNASEVALEKATLDWLPARRPRGTTLVGSEIPQIELLLGRLSERLEQEHGDDWLSDVLRAGASVELQEGFRNLREAIQENASGRFRQAASMAQRAQTSFRQAGSFAGLARAQLEEIYSYQRSTQGEACLAKADELESKISIQRFPWIGAQLKLDKASCMNLLGRLAMAEMESNNGSAIAQMAHYKILSLRARGILAGVATARGDRAFALEQDLQGLRDYWIQWYPLERLYQFYSDMTFITEAAGFWDMSYELERQAVDAISQTKHRELEALCRLRFARAAIMIGEEDTADYQLGKADDLFTLLLPSELATSYRIDGIMGIARAEADLGHYDRATFLLEHSARQLPPSESRLLLRGLYQLKGDLAMKRGALVEADSSYQVAVAIAESSLRQLRNPFERLLWKRETSSSYRSLVQVFLDENDAATALLLWEAFKSTLVRDNPIAPPVDLPQLLSPNFTIDLRPSFRELPHILSDHGEVLVSFAILPGGPIVWLVSDQQVLSAKLNITAAELRKRSIQFAEECGDPESDLEKVHWDSRELYQILIAPIEAKLPAGALLVLETDEELSMIPFEVLTNGGDHNLGERFPLVYSPGTGFRRHLRPMPRFTANTAVLVVGDPELAPHWKSELGPLPSARAEAEMITGFFPRSVLLTGRDATNAAIMLRLPNMEIFHFAGHSIRTGGGAALLLAQRIGSADGHDELTVASFSSNSLRTLRLAVLSACATAAQGENNAEDLAQAFLAAGVPEVIVTRWPVASTMALDMMRDLYQQLLLGNSPALALKQVLEASHRRNTRVRPYAWATFMLWGRG